MKTPSSHLEPHLPWLNFSPSFPPLLPPLPPPSKVKEDGGLQAHFSPAPARALCSQQLLQENIHLLWRGVLHRLPCMYLLQHGPLHGLQRKACSTMASSPSCGAMPAPGQPCRCCFPSSDLRAHRAVFLMLCHPHSTPPVRHFVLSSVGFHRGTTDSPDRLGWVLQR